MAEKIRIIALERLPGYLHVEIGGTFDLKEAEAVANAISNARSEGGFRKVLLDVRKVTGTITIVDRYDLGKSVGLSLDASVRTAMLCLPQQILPDKFFENVVRNIGARYMITTDLTDALQWLEAGDTPPGH